MTLDEAAEKLADTLDCSYYKDVFKAHLKEWRNTKLDTAASGLEGFTCYKLDVFVASSLVLAHKD